MTSSIVRVVWRKPNLESGKLPLAQAIPAGEAYRGMGKEALERAASPGSPNMADGMANGVSNGTAPMITPNVAITSAPVDPGGLLVTLGDTLSSKTREVVAGAAPNLRAALILGSPDFMRR